MIDNVEFALVGLGLGLAGAGAMVAAGRTRRADTGQPAVVAIAAMAVGSTAGLLGAAAWWTVPSVFSAIVVGTVAGAVVRPAGRARSDLVLAVAVGATGVGYLLLPDTEGTLVVGGALVPLAAVAVWAPRRWTAPASGAAVGGLVALVASVSIVAAAHRWATLAVAAATSLVVAGLITAALVLAGRVITSEQGPPTP